MSNINNNTSQQIDFGLLPKNIPSLCIPRVFANISESRIRKTFEDIFIGRIEKIDIIKGDKFNRVFVHLIWNNTADALYVRNQVMTGKDIKVIYDGPWFWMVSASRNQTPPQRPPQPPQQLSHKTDEFGRELRTTMQEQPLIKPILQRQRACFQPPPMQSLPMPILQKHHACFQPPLPPTPPPPMQMQMQRQDHRPLQPQNYHHYHHQQPPPPQRRQQQPIKKDHHQQQKQQQQLTDEFGRDIRRPQQQQQQPSYSHRPPSPVSENQKQKSWSSYDDDDEDDEAELHNKPVFIPQSPTSTPPSLRRKQIKVEQEVQEVQEVREVQEVQVHIIEQEVHIIEEEEEQEPSLTRRSTDVDHPRQADLVQVKYDVVLPLKKIRTNNKKSKK